MTCETYTAAWSSSYRRNNDETNNKLAPRAGWPSVDVVRQRDVASGRRGPLDLASLQRPSVVVERQLAQPHDYTTSFHGLWKRELGVQIQLQSTSSYTSTLTVYTYMILGISYFQKPS